MRRSDNTSLLRCLEYPRVDAADADGAWGVSVHTDFECFSLLHEDTPGLELCAPDGTWHLPAEAASAADASWILIVGDMVEILSSGYILATPHRVRPTRAVANAPRSPLDESGAGPRRPGGAPGSYASALSEKRKSYRTPTQIFAADRGRVFSRRVSRGRNCTSDEGGGTTRRSGRRPAL